jgi:hypothetical protein
VKQNEQNLGEQMKKAQDSPRKPKLAGPFLLEWFLTGPELTPTWPLCKTAGTKTCKTFPLIKLWEDINNN